jgi:hypothetical protein
VSDSLSSDHEVLYSTTIDAFSSSLSLGCMGSSTSGTRI